MKKIAGIGFLTVTLVACSGSPAPLKVLSEQESKELSVFVSPDPTHWVEKNPSQSDVLESPITPQSRTYPGCTTRSTCGAQIETVITNSVYEAKRTQKELVGYIYNYGNNSANLSQTFTKTFSSSLTGGFDIAKLKLSLGFTYTYTGTSTVTVNNIPGKSQAAIFAFPLGMRKMGFQEVCVPDGYTSGGAQLFACSNYYFDSFNVTGVGFATF